jgi:hypothetical protein
MRICVSIPVHEQPSVVLDQILNFRSFLPADTVIVLHLSQGFGQDINAVAQLLPDGVYVNPTSFPTTWGNLVHLHNSNIAFARTKERFDYVLLHASNDMYLRGGAEGFLAQHVAGIQRQPTYPEKPWNESLCAYRDEALGAMLQELNATEIFGSQPEGIFFQADLFDDMSKVIERHWSYGEGETYLREEIYYSTISAHLLGDTSIAAPVVYSEVCRYPITADRIWQLAAGTYSEGPYDSADPVAPPYRLYDFDNLYAVKRINRVIDDPLRTVVRCLTKAQMATVSPAVDDCVVVASATELLQPNDALKSWLAAFSDKDPVKLVILVWSDDGASEITERFVSLATSMGVNDEGSSRLELRLVGRDSFEEAALLLEAHAAYSFEALPVAVLKDLPLFPPRGLRDLKEFSRSVVEANTGKSK